MKVRKRTFIVISASIVFGSIAVAAATSRYSDAMELQYYRSVVVKPKGFASSPVLDNIKGGFSFISDREIIHLDEGTAKVTPNGIVSEGQQNGISVMGMARDGSVQCSVKGKRGVRYDFESMTAVPYQVDENNPADFIFEEFYRYPGQMKNRVQGSCGPVVLSLDGSAKVSKAPKNEALGDIYWKPVGGFIDKLFTSDGSRDKIAVREHKDPTKDRTISIIPPEEGRYVRSLIGVAYDGRLVFMLKDSSDMNSWIYFGRYVNGEIDLEDPMPLETSDYENIAISLDGTLVAYKSKYLEPGKYNIEVRNLKTSETTIVGNITTTRIRSMMISPKNSYLALQLDNAIVWKKL